MPTYQYACRSCGHRFDEVQGFHEATLTTCPQCQQEDLRKLFGDIGVVFKGPGFYRTDSRSAHKSGGSDKSKPKEPVKSDGNPTAPATASTSSPATAPSTSSSASDSGPKTTASK